jgi:hypothetical protein
MYHQIKRFPEETLRHQGGYFVTWHAWLGSKAFFVLESSLINI